MGRYWPTTGRSSLRRLATGAAPAATQVVLNGRGIRRTEADLARRMGTDTDGTGVGRLRS